MTVRQLANLLRSADPDTGALSAPSPNSSGAAQDAGTLAGPDSSAVLPGAGPDDPSTADPDRAPLEKLPAPVPNAENIARARAISAALRSHGLVRRVPGYDSWTYVASEHASIFYARLPPGGAAPSLHPEGTVNSSKGGVTGLHQGGIGGRQPLSAESARAAAGQAYEEGGERDAAVPMELDEAGARVVPVAIEEGGKEVLLMPWLDHLGRVNRPYWQALVRRVLSVVVRNPGASSGTLVLLFTYT